MLIIPAAPRRAALLTALERLVADAGDPARLLASPLAPARLEVVRGPSHLARLVFEAAGMTEPEVVVMGGSGAATGFRSEGKTVLRMGADLAPSAAIASVVAAAASLWRQTSELPPSASEDDDLATSVYLSLGAAEASAVHLLGDRDRAAGLVFLLAAQSLARNDPGRTAAVAWDLREPLDTLYEDALRLLALRGDELRARFRVEGSAPLMERSSVEPPGRALTAGAAPTPELRAQSIDDAYRQVAAQPCPCGGRWRVAERAAPSADAAELQLTLVCRVCFQWRTASWRLAPPA